MEIKKDVNELYLLLSDILGCDYLRLVEAIDEVNVDILSNAICEAREGNDLSIERIMREVIDLGFDECASFFYKECNEKLALLDENLDEYEVLDNLDVDIIKDSIQYEDGICWSESFSDYTEEEMIVYLTYLEKSFGKLMDIIGYIDGLPEEN